METKKSISLRALCVTAIMGALGAALMFVEFAIPIIPNFIKFDFSELPALITTFAFGPQWGVLCCLVKNLLHLPFGSTMGVGELSNFILGAAYMLVAGLIYKFRHNKKWAIIATLIGSVVMAAVSLPLNYFIIYPLYFNVLNFPEEAILGMYQAILPSTKTLASALTIFNVPFTFVKGLADALICIFLYKPLSPLLHGSRKKKKNEEVPQNDTDIEI